MFWESCLLHVLPYHPLTIEKTRVALPKPTWHLLLVLLLANCQREVAPTAYVSSAHNRFPIVIDMANTMHLTPSEAVIDSVVLVRRVLDSVMVPAKNQLKLVVYFTGSGSWDLRRARAAGCNLKQLLVKFGYDESRITYEAKPFALDSTQKSRFRKVNFIVNQGAHAIQH